MEFKPIKTEEDYRTAQAEIESLWEAAEGTPKADRLEVLVLLLEDYEHHHHPIAPPNPIDLLAYAMESRGLTRKDLKPFIGNRARMAEVMNRIRPLSLGMIRKLAAGLSLPADVLIQPYPLRKLVV